MATKKSQEIEKKFIFTSENVDKINQQILDGYVIKRYQNPWFKNEAGIRRSGLSFGITPEEVEEYIRCKVDIHYFAEKYCKVKREDGSIGNIKLRNYQKDILDLYDKNRFSILMGSRQIGKCFLFNTTVSIEGEGKTRVGILYYKIVSKYRKITFKEKLKILLYNIIYLLDK